MISEKREAAVAYARSLIGTRFHHAARVPGAGVDCVGLVVLTGAHIGAWPEGFDVLPYPPAPTLMQMRSKCREYLNKLDFKSIQEGDVVLIIPDKLPQHLGVVGRHHSTGGLSLIHSCNTIPDPRVVEMPLVFSSAFRFCEAYSFPGIDL